MKQALIVIVVLVVIALIFGGMYVSRRNQMVTLNETVKSDWAQVDVVLQRRSDLIPNLVETVKGFAAHETTVYRRYRQSPRGSGRRADPQGQDRRQWPARWRAQPFAGGRGELSAIADPTRTSCTCRTNWPARRIALPSSASATTTRSRPTTPSSASFRTIFSQLGRDSSATTRTSPRRKPRAKCPRSNFRTPRPQRTDEPSNEHSPPPKAEVFRRVDRAVRWHCWAGTFTSMDRTNRASPKAMTPCRPRPIVTKSSSKTHSSES